MKKLAYGFLLLLFVMLNMEGCVLLAAGAAGAATTAVVVNDRRPLKTITDDKNIEFTAASRINQNIQLSQNSHIVVVSFNHSVLLVGQVPDASVRQQAASLIQSLPKVARIYNELEIAPPTTPIVRSDDAWITTKVKTKMLETKDLHSGLIKVITENGNVYLMGIVTRHQATLAADATRRVGGVKRVVTLFEYLY